MSRRKSALSCLLAVLACILGSACGSSADGGMTLYSGQHEQTTTLLVAAFERDTKIAVHVRTGDEASLGNEVLQEGASSPADVFYSANTPVLETLREHGLLAAVAPSTLAQVPARDSSAGGLWVGVSARVSALVYNTAALSPAELPSSILDLAKPRFRGKVAFAPSETDFQPLLTGIARRDGATTAELWLKALQAGAHTYPDNETVVARVNDGSDPLGLIDHYYWYRLRAELGRGGTHTALHYFAPGDVGELVDVSGAAQLRTSAHAAAAQRFLAFLVGPTAQGIIARSRSYEYPLRPGVAPAVGLKPLASIRASSLTPAELGDGSLALSLEQKVGLL